MDQNTLYLLCLLLALFAFFLGLLCYDSKALGMPIKMMGHLMLIYCDKHKMTHHEFKIDNSSFYDELLKKPHILDFFKNHSVTIRFILWVLSPSSSDLWIDKQKDIFSDYILTRLSFLWNYFQNLFIDKSHHTICGICGTICETTVSECWHCGLIQIACKKCFKERDRCAFCKPLRKPKKK